MGNVRLLDFVELVDLFTSRLLEQLRGLPLLLVYNHSLLGKPVWQRQSTFH